MTAWWSYVPKQQKLQEQALSWQKEAEQQVTNLFNPDTAVDNLFSSRSLLDDKTMESIVSNKPKGGGLLDDIGEVFDAVTSPVFGGEVRQPWDVLRPLKRLQDWEQTNIARPAARGLVQDILGMDYASTPGVVRFGLETLLSPSSWIPGTAILGKVGLSTAKLPWAAKMGINLLVPDPIITPQQIGRLAKVAPSMARSLPVLRSLFLSPGSDRAAQLALENIVGGTPIAGIVAKQDIPGYHGTIDPFYDEAGDALPSSPESRTRYQASHEGVVYYGTTPEVADAFNGYDMAKGGGWTAQGLAAGGRTYPTFIKQGTKLFDPSVDEWPATIANNTELRQRTEEMALRQADNQQWGGSSETPFLDEITRTSSRENADATIQALKKEGYSGIYSFNEMAIWDQSVVESQFRNTPNLSLMDRLKTGVADLKAKRQSPLSQAQSALKAEDEALLGDQTRRSMEGATANTVFEQDLSSSAELASLKKKADAGTITDVELQRMDTLVKRYERRRSVGTQAATPQTPGMQTLLDGVNSQTDSIMMAQSPEELIMDALASMSLSQNARQALFNHLPEDLSKAIAKHGYRLMDGDLGPILTRYARMKAIGHNFGSASVDFMEQAAKAGDVQLDKLGRVVSIGGVDIPGTPYVEDLIRNYRKFNLTPAQEAAIRSMIEPIHHALDVARAFGVRGIPDKELPDGLWVGIKGDEEQPLAVRFKSRQPVTRQEILTNKAEAIALKQATTPFYQAQHSFINQLMNASADRWLDEAIKPYGKTLNDLLPQDVLREATTAKTYLEKIDSFDTLLAKSIDSRKVRFTAPQWKGFPPALEPFVKRAEAATRTSPSKGYMNERRRVLREIRDQLKGVKQPLATRKQQLDSSLARARDIIARSKGTTDYPAFVEGTGRYFPEVEGRQLRSTLMPRETNDFISTFNRHVRPLMAVLDASFMSNQGLMGLSLNPKAYLDSVIAAFSSDAYDGMVARQFQSGVAQDLLRHGTAWMARNDLSEFMNEFSFTGLPEKIPGAKLANTWFQRFGNALRFQLGEALIPLARSQADPEKAMDELGRTLNLMTGITDSPVTRMEQIMEFAPRFTRANLGLLSDAVTKGNLSGQVARKALLNLIIGGSALVYGVNKAFGEETDLDPRHKDFMTLKLGGQKISPFGTYTSLVKAVQELYRAGGDPMATGTYIARAKASPAMSHLYNLIAGETYTGEPLNFGSVTETIQSLAISAKQNLPISATQAVEDLLTEGPSADTAFGAGLGFIGARSRPISAADRRESLSEELYGKSWSRLSPFEKTELISAHPEAKVLPVDKAFKARATISERFQEAYARLDANVPPGPQWREEYTKLRQQETGAYTQWEYDFPDAADNLQRSPGRTPEERALQAYYGIFEEARETGMTSEDLVEALDMLESSWSPSQSAYVAKNTGLKSTPVAKEYRAAQRILEPYWEIEDAVWARVANRAPYNQFNSLREFTLAQGEALRGRVPDSAIATLAERNPMVQRLKGTISTLRQRYRIAHPEVDAELVKWYGATPIRMQSISR